MEELLESDEALEEELVDRQRLLSPCALRLCRRWGSTSGGGEHLASAMGSGVASSSEDLLDSSLGLDAASGAPSHSGSGSLEVSQRCW